MTDRKVTLSVSKDFGHNFQHQREADLPAIGEYARVPVEFRRFGHARDFRVKVRVTSPVVVDFMGGEVDYEVGDA